jgi:hypothetical protein
LIWFFAIYFIFIILLIVFPSFRRLQCWCWNSVIFFLAAGSLEAEYYLMDHGLAGDECLH